MDDRYNAYNDSSTKYNNPEYDANGLNFSDSDIIMKRKEAKNPESMPSIKNLRDPKKLDQSSLT